MNALMRLWRATRVSGAPNQQPEEDPEVKAEAEAEKEKPFQRAAPAAGMSEEEWIHEMPHTTLRALAERGALFKIVNEGRCLPAAYAPTLQRLIDQRHPRLYRYLRLSPLREGAPKKRADDDDEEDDESQAAMKAAAAEQNESKASGPSTPFDLHCSQDLKEKIDEAIAAELDDDWEELFAEVTTTVGKSLSTSEKKTKNLHSMSLVYGEINFTTLARVMCKHVPLTRDDLVFYDLGSGTGRGIFAAGLLHPFKKCAGIEILESLHKAAQRVLKKYEKRYLPPTDANFAAVAAARNSSSSTTSEDGTAQPIDPAELEKPLGIAYTPAKNVQLECGDFRQIDWSDGDVVFANSTCFEQALMHDLGNEAAKLKEGAWFISLTKPLNNAHFKIIETTQLPMSWGYATIVTQRKITPPCFTAARDNPNPLASGNDGGAPAATPAASNPDGSAIAAK